MIALISIHHFPNAESGTPSVTSQVVTFDTIQELETARENLRKTYSKDKDIEVYLTVLSGL